MQFLCTWHYGSFYTPQRVDTSKALHSGTLPWAECNTSLQKRMVVLVCLPKALDNQPRSVSHPQHPVAQCRRYPEFRRKTNKYSLCIHQKKNINIYIYMLNPPKIYFLHPFVCPKFCQKVFCTIKNINPKKLKKIEKNENKQKTKRNQKKQKNKRLWGNSG